MNFCNDECTSPTNWDYIQLDFIKNNIKPTDKFLDLGVYQGIFLNFVSNFIPYKNITGIEMDVKAFNSLEHRFNNTGVNLLNLAISNKNGTIDYFNGCDGGCPNIFGEHYNKSFVGTKIGSIQSYTLDTLFPEQTFEFVKIDIEGAELQALEGGKEFLKRSNIILIECHTDTEFPLIYKILTEEINKDVYFLKYFHKKTIESPFSYQIIAINKNSSIQNGIVI